MADGRKHPLLKTGTHAPEFTLQRLDGPHETLREIVARGPAVLAFYKVNCPVCQMTFPFLERLHSAGRLPVYGISQNGAEDTHDFNREFGITLPTLLDTHASGFPASNAFGISSVPTLFVVETDGTVSRVIEGWHKSDIAQLGERAGVQPFQPGDSVPEAKAG